MQEAQPEHQTQKRLLNQLSQELGWRYVGNWQYNRVNHCVEQAALIGYLQKRYPADLARAAVDELQRAVEDQRQDLYHVNKEVYRLLRYGVKVKPGPGRDHRDVYFIDWKEPSRNDFTCAEEVSIKGVNNKRPDVVLYVNGIALGVIELKRSTVGIGDGIRQLIGNQREDFIRPFFHTSQILIAANESQGLRYGTTKTPEKYYLRWKEQGPPSPEPNLLRREVRQLLAPARFLELIHDFVLFDGGVKKICRPHQYFAVKAGQKRIQGEAAGASTVGEKQSEQPGNERSEQSGNEHGEQSHAVAKSYIESRESPIANRGGIFWHTQGSGKSLTMVWFAQWIIEHVTDARILIITDRDELDKQIVNVFDDAGKTVERATSGAHLLRLLNAHEPAMICSLVHKFGTGEKDGSEEDFVRDVRAALPANFRPKGDLYVFVDEAHRTQSGKLNRAMKEAVLPQATFIGFTGTPLLADDKQRSVEIFGPYIGQPYKFDEAVADGVVLDLRYEARDIEQRISNPERIDRWFESKTRGLTDIAQHQLKRRWGTMKEVLSSRSRLDQIVQDVCLDFTTIPRLETGAGNAMLVAGSVYQACQYYELFQRTELAGNCAIVTSYVPAAQKIAKEDSGAVINDELKKYEVYRAMLGEESPEAFETRAKKQFIDEPGRMRLLIVVDKLLTGFDAPSATYLYIDKSMRDHGLFQAICRVNRLDGAGKDYGYIIDYKDLFRSLEKSITDYTGEAFDNYERADVEGLLKDRIAAGRERLDAALDACEAILEPIPGDTMDDRLIYFCGRELPTDPPAEELTERRKFLYKNTAELSRAFAALASDLDKAGYSTSQTLHLRSRTKDFEALRRSVQLRSGDKIDLKRYEADMRRLIDLYIQANPSEKVSNLEDYSLIQLIVERGVDEAVATMPEELAANEANVAETIEANVRAEIVEKQPTNPAFFARMSELLDELIELRRQRAIEYREFLDRIAELTNRVTGQGVAAAAYPPTISSPRARVLYDNLAQDAELTMRVEEGLRRSARDGWQDNPLKGRAVRRAIEEALAGRGEFSVEDILRIVRANA